MFNTPKMNWPLSIEELKKIHKAALDILATIGMVEPPDFLVEIATQKGCTVNDKGRLCFPPALIEDIIANSPPREVYPARDEKQTIDLNDGLAHSGHHGIAPMVVDFETGEYRNATLIDLYDINRLVDALPNQHIGGGIIIPSDIKDPVDQIVNKFYTTMAGTTKHLVVDITNPVQVDPAIELVETILGGDQYKKERSPITFGFVPTKSPLSFEKEFLTMSVEVCKKGYPVSSIIAAQSGSTAPAALAGALAMTTAEALGAFAALKIVVPGHPILLGIWPFVSDLRSAAFAGAPPESSLLMGGAAQILEWYGIEGCVAAGMTDSKTVDAQSGYEKGISVALTAIAGSKIIGESAGMQASLMAASFEAFVVDNEMLEGINRIKRGIVVNDETLALNDIDEIVKGEGNFLFSPETMKNMRTEYVYPEIADRTSFTTWEKNGRQDIRDSAREKTRELLSSHYPECIHPDLDAKVREKFNIMLPASEMKASCNRW